MQKSFEWNEKKDKKYLTICQTKTSYSKTIENLKAIVS